MNDLKFAFRQLLKNPGFTAIAVLTLALGIGANTAMFSIVNGVLLKPLPFHASDHLVWLYQNKPQRELLQWPMGTHRFQFWRDHSQSFEQLALAGPVDFQISTSTGPEMLTGLTVTANLGDLLGVSPALGRSFLPEENLPGAPAVVMLSHRLWQGRFNGDPEIVGKSVQHRERSYTIIGVLPRDLQFPIGTMPAWRVISKGEPDVWLPAILQPQAAPETDLGFVLGRLKPGVTRDQAQAEMLAVTGRYETVYPKGEGWSVQVVPLREQVTGRVRSALLLLFGALAAVLLIACVNIANLLLARTLQRQREFAIRAAIGAGRSRMARQLVTESMTLTLLGGVLGTLTAFLIVKMLKSSASIPLPLLDGIGIDVRVLAFTFGISVLVGLFFGLTPLWWLSRKTSGWSMLGGQPVTGGTPRTARLRGTLVTGQVALSFVLLITAGLLLRSFTNVLGVNTGYDPDQLLVMNLSLAPPESSTGASMEAIVKELLERVEGLPGVAAAGFSFGAPLVEGVPIRKVFRVEGWADALGGDDTYRIRLRIVSSNYFSAMQVPLLHGRGFSANSHLGDGEQHEVLINQSAARLAFPEGDPLGRSSNFGPIVGVVADTLDVALDQPPEPQFYIEGYSAAEAFLVIRTVVPPGTLAAAVVRELGALDKNLAVANVRTLGQRMSESLVGRRVQMMVVASFSIVALLLTVVGIAGVANWSVNQRRSEIGLRVALGASGEDVFRLIVGEGLTPVLVGMTLGLVTALAGTRLLENQLFGVTATDPATLVIVCLVMLVVATIACWGPARRAVSIDPMEALRSQ